MKRFTSMMSAVCLFLAAPSLALDAKAEEISVIYANSNLVVPVHDGFKAHFEKTHDDSTVRFEGVLEYTDALAVALRQSLVGAQHDLGYYGMSDVCTLAGRGIAKPLDDLIESDPQWRELGLSDGSLELTKCDGVTYGLPFGASYMMVIFNKDLVAKAGGDPENLPTTWLAIFELARKIDSPSGGISFNYDASSSWSFMTLVLSRGGSILSPDGADIAFDSPEGLEAMKILAEAGAVRGHTDLSKAQGRQAFISGTLGILVDSSSGLVNYKKATEGKFELGLVRFPIAEDGGVPASGMAAVLQTDGGAKEALAWDYLKYSVSPEGQTLLGKATGFQPFNQKAIDDSDRLGTYYAENPELGIAAQSVRNVVPWPAFPGPNGLKIHQLVTNYMQKVYTGALQPEVALAELAKETRALLK